MRIRPVIEVFEPMRQGRTWTVRAVVHTPLGPVNVSASAEEALATAAIARVRSWLSQNNVGGEDVGGFFDDLASSIQKVTKSKAFNDVMTTARTVLKNPMFRGLAGKIPYVSTVVDAADAAFELTDGLNRGSPRALGQLQKVKALATSQDPATALKGQRVLAGLQTAGKAKALYQALQKNDPKALAKWKRIQDDAAKGVPAAVASLRAVQSARTHVLRRASGGLVRRAAAGDIAAQQRLTAIHDAATRGETWAQEAAARLKEVVRAQPPMEVPAPEQEGADYVPEALTVLAPDLDPEAAAGCIAGMLSEDISGDDAAGAALTPQQARLLAEWRQLQRRRRSVEAPPLRRAPPARPAVRGW